MTSFIIRNVIRSCVHFNFVSTWCYDVIRERMDQWYSIFFVCLCHSDISCGMHFGIDFAICDQPNRNQRNDTMDRSSERSGSVQFGWNVWMSHRNANCDVVFSVVDSAWAAANAVSAKIGGCENVRSSFWSNMQPPPSSPSPPTTRMTMRTRWNAQPNATVI